MLIDNIRLCGDDGSVNATKYLIELAQGYGLQWNPEWTHNTTGNAIGTIMYLSTSGACRPDTNWMRRFRCGIPQEISGSCGFVIWCETNRVEFLTRPRFLRRFFTQMLRLTDTGFVSSVGTQLFADQDHGQPLFVRELRKHPESTCWNCYQSAERLEPFGECLGVPYQRRSICWWTTLQPFMDSSEVDQAPSV